MATNRRVQRIQSLYAWLLRMYPKTFHCRFGDQMQQTFNDLLRERVAAERSLFGFLLRVFGETLAGAIGENMAACASRNKAFVPILLVTALILLVPLIAMQFTDEVNWNVTDFIVAGILLIGAGLAFARLARQASNLMYRAAAAIAVGTVLFLTWANLAVGIIGNESNPANLMYVAVIVVGVIGTVVVRHRPDGMARTLLAMAVVQTTIGVVAQVSGMEHNLLITVFFVALWLSSAWMFRRSGAGPETKI